MWRAALSGTSACLVGIGLARFGYTPLIPALIGAHWFSPAATVYFGAANLAGYVLGAVAARSLVRLSSAATVLRLTMVVVTLSFFASADPLSWGWFFLWRFLSGAGGAAIMVVAPPTILAHVPAGRRGMMGGVIFSGVGLGIALSGTAVPLLVGWGVTETWVGLGVMSALLTAAAWNGWPATTPRKGPTRLLAPTAFGWIGLGILALLVEYMLLAFAQAPHMVFLVDYIARGLGLGIARGGFYWVVYGLGAVAGPLAAGRLADWIGFRAMARAGFIVIALMIGVLLTTHAAPALVLSSFVVGALTPGMVPVFVGRTQEIVTDPDHRQAAWAAATTAFSIGLAGAGYLYSFVFAASDGDYRLLFAIGVGAALLALIIDIAVPLAQRRHLRAA